MHDHLLTLAKLQQDHLGFTRLSALLHQLTGIHLPLTDKNLSLIACRVSPILRARGLEDYQAYLAFLPSSADAIQEFVSALTTNTTEFFRESLHFDCYRKLLVEKAAKSSKCEIRIWCAASSTGQEPYSIAMTSLEATTSTTHAALKILATDIDLDVLGRAQQGEYTERECVSLPVAYRQKYFTPSPGGFRAKDQLREAVRFAPFNLISESYPFQHRFDFIFCRNVLIYFNKETCEYVLQRLVNMLAPGGVLFVGHSETGIMKSTEVEVVSHAAYRKKGSE